MYNIMILFVYHYRYMVYPIRGWAKKCVPASSSKRGLRSPKQTSKRTVKERFACDASSFLINGSMGIIYNGSVGYCIFQISHFKIPKYIFIEKDGFPLTASGKVQKHILREMAIQRISSLIKSS